MATRTVDEVNRLARTRIIELGASLNAQMADLTGVLHKGLADAIEQIRGDQQLLDLLYASIESNLETLAHIMRYDIPIKEVSSPSAAEEYARRLAQRGISSIALVRAYRLGQALVLEWAFRELGRHEPDPQVAFSACQLVTALTFRYIDSVSEQVVIEYENERERWLANRNTVRAAMLEELISGEQIDAGAAEQALGYRLRQHHLGVVLWEADLRQLERFLHSLSKAVGAGQPMFFATDRTSAWGWVPLGREAATVGLEAVAAELERESDTLMVALGSTGAWPDGVPCDASRGGPCPAGGGRRARVRAPADVVRRS